MIKRNTTVEAMRILTPLAAVVLLAGLSVEIISGDNIHFTGWYLGVLPVVCLVFIVDFFVDCATNPDPERRFWRHLPFLLLSIPYLNIIRICGAEMTRAQAMAVGLVTMLRAFMAMFVVVRWMVRGSGPRRLFYAYIFTVAVFTYLSALVFYDYEIHVNPHLTSFGNAVWWAGMGVTTVGAAIFPVTTMGKIFAVLLPMVGMLMFPIFTVYVTDIYTRKKERS